MIIHTAGAPEGLVQRCARCGVVLQDYTNTQGVGDWRPVWWDGNVFTDGRFSGATEEPANCRPEIDDIHADAWAGIPAHVVGVDYGYGADVMAVTIGRREPDGKVIIEWSKAGPLDEADCQYLRGRLSESEYERLIKDLK
jgi:hypothetical protein